MNKRRLAHKPIEYTGTGTPLVATRTPDPYVGIPEVIALNDRMFDNFIRGQDVTMVFFYDKRNEMSEPAKNSLKQAAQKMRREGDAFGAVNCPENKLLCMKQSVFGVTLPAFKLYSGGSEVNVFDWTLRPEDIRKFVDIAPEPVPHRSVKTALKCLFRRNKK